MSGYSFAMQKNIPQKDICLYLATFQSVYETKDLYYFCFLENGFYSYPKLVCKGKPLVQQSLYEKTFSKYFKINEAIAMKRGNAALDIFNRYHAPQVAHVFSEAQLVFRYYAIQQLQNNNQITLSVQHNPNLGEDLPKEPQKQIIYFAPSSDKNDKSLMPEALCRIPH